MGKVFGWQNCFLSFRYATSKEAPVICQTCLQLFTRHNLQLSTAQPSFASEITITTSVTAAFAT